MTPEDLAERFDRRSGYAVVCYREVGLPLYSMTCVATLLARSRRSTIEEFILRALAAGLEAPEQLEQFLGLSQEVVSASIAETVRREEVRVGSSPGKRLQLTERGLAAIDEEHVVRPVERTIVFTIDGLTRKPCWYKLPLHSPRELAQRGLADIRAYPARPPELAELPVAEVSDVVGLSAGNERETPHDVLRIRSIEKRQRQFVPAIALVFRAKSGSDIQVAFVIDGRLSEEHELAFARGRCIERQQLFRELGSAAASDKPMEGLGALVQVAAARGAVADAARRLKTAKTKDEQAAASGAKKLHDAELKTASEAVAALVARPIAVYEHAPLLERAIANARERLVIISPWIRRAVVGKRFLRTIRAALERNVRVMVGYGFGERDARESEADEEATAALQELSGQFPNMLFRRLGDTHAKVLIQDSEFYVTTSFNWLSFRGDPNRPFREEWGTIVRDGRAVDELYEALAKRFA